MTAGLQEELDELAAASVARHQRPRHQPPHRVVGARPLTRRARDPRRLDLDDPRPATREDLDNPS